MKHISYGMRLNGKRSYSKTIISLQHECGIRDSIKAQDCKSSGA